MNVLLITDLEGVPGVLSIDYMDRAREEYIRAKRCLTQCINTVTGACIAAGADKVYYFDGHGGVKLDNIDHELISPEAIRVDNDGWQELIRSGKVDCVMELGSHARAGTVNGFLDHTINSKKIFSHKINGREFSELALHAAFCGAYGVPFVACIGDEAACLQAREYVPEIFTAAVKKAECRNLCTDYPDAGERMCATVKKALAGLATVPPMRISLPAVVEITYYRTDMCEEKLFSSNDGELLRADARTLVKKADSLSGFHDLNI